MAWSAEEKRAFREEMKARTKRFALRVMKLVDALPNARSAYVVGNQLIRAATSVGANYRAACRGRSEREFLAKLGIVEEEADECGYWLELIAEHGLLPENRVRDLIGEANEIVAVTISAIRSTRGKTPAD